MAGKLVIVGGGSAYTPDIIMGLLAEPGLFAGWEWVLHDVDAYHARIMAALVTRLAHAAGAEVRVRHTGDLAEAVANAGYILAQPRPGGLRHRALDERIPLRLGCIGQETVGPGGFAFAWRSIPVMMDLLATVARLAPAAWVISYTNPAGMVTEAVIRQFPTARFIGLCDMAPGLQMALARVLRVDPQRLELDYRGINHGAWVDRILLDGRQDLLPRVLKLARWIPAGLLPLNEITGAVRLLQATGRLGDPYLRYYYFTTAALARLRAARRCRAEVVMARVSRLYRHYQAESIQQRPHLRLHRGHASHGDMAARLIRDLVAGRPARQIIQQRNPGHLHGLPAGQAAQFPALVEPAGWQPLPVPPLPEPQAELLRRVQAAEGRNVAAALSGDRAEAVAAMAMNPLVPDRRLAARLVEELLAAHRPFLPQFYH